MVLFWKTRMRAVTIRIWIIHKPCGLTCKSGWWNRGASNLALDPIPQHNMQFECNTGAAVMRALEKGTLHEWSFKQFARTTSCREKDKQTCCSGSTPTFSTFTNTVRELNIGVWYQWCSYFY